MIDWEAVLKQLGGTAVVLAAISYVVTKAFDSFMAARGEDFKAKLLREAEDHKANLDRSNHEHSVRFAALHAERANVIKTLYAKVQALVTVFDDHTELLEMGLSHEDYAKRIHNALKPVQDYFSAHRIYLSRDLCTDIAKLIATVSYARGLFIDIAVMNFSATEQNQEINKQTLASFITTVVTQRDEAMSILSKLETEFRTLLGNS